MKTSTTHDIVHASYSGIRAFVALKISWCKLIGNYLLILLDTVTSTVSLNIMRTLLLCLGLFLLSFISFAQINKLTIDFKPSFIHNSRLTLQTSPDGNLMTLEADVLTEESIVSDSALNHLNNYLEKYNFVHTGAIDTIDQKKIIENGDTVVQYQIRIGKDGITVYGELLKNDQKKTFEFWTPNKGDKNHELIDILFRLMYAHFECPITINYLEQLEQYFDFGLGLRKLHNEPLTFKLYGSISANDKDGLHKFFDSLPDDFEVFIDMSNFNGMARMLDNDFRELTESHQLITFINCSENAKIILKRAAIKWNRYE